MYVLVLLLNERNLVSGCFLRGTSKEQVHSICLNHISMFMDLQLKVGFLK